MLVVIKIVPLTYTSVSQNMSHVARRLENLSLGFPIRSDTNRAVQPHQMAKDMKFRIKEVERKYYLYSESKGTDQHLYFHICIKQVFS